MAALHTPPTKVLISYPLKTNNKSHTKEPTVRKMKVMGKSGQENGPKAEKYKTERAKDKAEEQERIYREVGSN